MLDLLGFERLDHAVLLGHAADPSVALDAHCFFPLNPAIVGKRPDARSCDSQARHT
jgi:hypothetical protein